MVCLAVCIIAALISSAASQTGNIESSKAPGHTNGSKDLCQLYNVVSIIVTLHHDQFMSNSFNFILIEYS